MRLNSCKHRNKFFLLASLLLSIKFVMADVPDATEHYKVTNNTGIPITNLSISDFLPLSAYTQSDVYHDPSLTLDLLNPGDEAPASGPGALVSYKNVFAMIGTFYVPVGGWNGWDISYCTSSGCYKSDMSLAVCTMGLADTTPGSVIQVTINPNGNITIKKPYSGTCELQLTNPGKNPYSPDWTEHYKVRNDSAYTITNLSVSDFMQLPFGKAGKILSGFYHDPILTANSVDSKETVPSTGLGGLVSYSNISNGLGTGYAFNMWDISYCTPSNCYKSDLISDTCSLKSDDIFSGSTAMITINEDVVNIYTASQAQCTFRLEVNNTRSPN